MLNDQIGGSVEPFASPSSDVYKFSSETRDLMRADLNLPKYRSSRLGQVNASGYLDPLKRYPSVLDPDNIHTKAELDNKYDRFPHSLRQAQQRESMSGNPEYRPYGPTTNQKYNSEKLEKSIPVFPYSYISEQKAEQQSCAAPPTNAGKQALNPFPNNNSGVLAPQNKDYQWLYGTERLGGEPTQLLTPQFVMFLFFLLILVLVCIGYRLCKLTKKVKSLKKKIVEIESK